MGFYQFERKQWFDQPLEVIWDFIAEPRNLKTITPPYMGFDIISKNLPDKMYQGMIIVYKVSPLLNIKTTWVTEITHISEKQFFVDEQRVGPYRWWHHQHILEEVDGRTLMTDIVSYRPPLGLLGDLANMLIIRKKLREIFDYRYIVLDNLFNAKKQPTKPITMKSLPR
jgi:ligand-binding SRPBCC domain-containing protein